MRRSSLISLSFACLTLAACGKTTVEGADAPNGKDKLALTELNTGCLQGVVINGLTGERIALPEGTDENLAQGKGISVRVNDEILNADLVSVDYAQNAAMKGEYTLCNVPLEETYPLYAQIDGFLPFGAKIGISSSVAQRSPKAESDIQKPVPTSIYNIRLYPVGTETQDLKVRVLYQSKPVAGARVQLTPSDKNVLDQGDFLAPANGDLMTANATTDGSGIATFAAASLVLGGVYDYTIMPPAGVGRTLFKGQDLVIGLLAAKAEHDAYYLQIDLDNTAPALKVVSQSDEPNKGGVKTCTLNRPVKLAYGTEDGIASSLAGADTATVKPSIEGNDSSESVNIELIDGGYTVKLSPIFEKLPNLVKEPNISVSFAGVMLMPADQPELMERFDLASQCSLTVNLQ